MENFMAGTAGYTAKLHSCIKFDGTPQELPVTNLFCTRSYKKTPESVDKVLLTLPLKHVSLLIDNFTLQ